ncbi:MAG: hypothetical protein KJ621_19200 [Proteobacteria bacterium]|nr:hypothetical protein [Pseudomonadota bacterium]MBU1742886.1 hypothetical protein [Pseudomonadota bacterium]
MGAGFRHECGRCGFAVQTSGPWEFCRDAAGKRREFGHPVPVSEEAARAGIHGLSGELYCPDCDRVVNVILVEYKLPARDGLSVWTGGAEPRDEYQQEDAVKCPRCGTTEMIFGEGEWPCPRCKEGTLKGCQEWIS